MQLDNKARYSIGLRYILQKMRGFQSNTNENQSRASNLDIVKDWTPLLKGFTISLQSIQAKINVLNTNKSSVPDIIASKLLRLMGNAIVSALTRLCSCSCETKNYFISSEDSMAHAQFTKKMTKQSEEIITHSPYSVFQAR